jgi:hypothetical protein
MVATRTLLSALYVAIAVLALLATWHQNLFYFQGGDTLHAFVEFWRQTLVTPASVSITVDLFLFGLAVVVWMVIEARRLGIRFVWVYVVLSVLIAISVMAPLFLAVRERRLAALGREGEAVALSGADLAVLAVFGLPAVIVSLWSLAW